MCLHLADESLCGEACWSSHIPGALTVSRGKGEKGRREEEGRERREEGGREGDRGEGSEKWRRGREWVEREWEGEYGEREGGRVWRKGGR